MQPELYQSSVLRMLRAVNLLDIELGVADWSADHEVVSDSLNALRESLQDFRNVLTDLSEPEAFAGNFEEKLREIDVYLQSSNTLLNNLRTTAFDMQLGLDPRLTSSLGIAIGELAQQMRLDYQTILIDERDMNPELFMLNDTGLSGLQPGLENDFEL
jgi:hypothetical protein